jgi:hypothetical protein
MQKSENRGKEYAEIKTSELAATWRRWKGSCARMLTNWTRIKS